MKPVTRDDVIKALADLQIAHAPGPDGPKPGTYFKIRESIFVTEDGEPYEEPRTWRERLFSLPWRPLQATRTITPKVPSRAVYELLDGSLVMHPETAAMVREAAKRARFGRSIDAPSPFNIKGP